MTLRINNESFWEISAAFLLDSRFRFGDRPAVTKFVYLPTDDVLVLGSGRETPSHKALMSSYKAKELTDTTHWVRGIVLRDKRIIYYRQGVQDLDWYARTTEMLKRNGLPDSYTIAWGPDAKLKFKDELAGFP